MVDYTESFLDRIVAVNFGPGITAIVGALASEGVGPNNVSNVTTPLSVLVKGTGSFSFGGDHLNVSPAEVIGQQTRYTDPNFGSAKFKPKSDFLTNPDDLTAALEWHWKGGLDIGQPVGWSAVAFVMFYKKLAPSFTVPAYDDVNFMVKLLGRPELIGGGQSNVTTTQVFTLHDPNFGNAQTIQASIKFPAPTASNQHISVIWALGPYESTL